MPDTTPKPLAALIERYLAQGDFAGVAVLAARHGKLMVEHYAGQAAPGLPVATAAAICGWSSWAS